MFKIFLKTEYLSSEVTGNKTYGTAGLWRSSGVLPTVQLEITNLSGRQLSRINRTFHFWASDVSALMPGFVNAASVIQSDF